MVVPEREVALMDAELEQQIRAFAIGRIGLGAATLLAPGPVLKKWFGKGQDSWVTRVLARYVGGRDIALGLGTLFALSHGSPVRGWLEAGMVADATDLAGTLLSIKHFPRITGISTALASAGGVAYARRLVSQLEGQSDGPQEPPAQSPQLSPVP
jgi:hypothetical protein